jgi:hypothetical protein
LAYALPSSAASKLVNTSLVLLRPSGNAPVGQARFLDLCKVAVLPFTSGFILIKYGAVLVVEIVDLIKFIE